MDFNSAFLDASSFHARNTFVLINCRIFRSLFCGAAAAAAAVTVVVVVVECFFLFCCVSSLRYCILLYIYIICEFCYCYVSVLYIHIVLATVGCRNVPSHLAWMSLSSILFPFFFFRYNFIFLHINSMPGYFANHIEHALWAFFSVLISTVIHWRRNEQNEMRKTVVKKRISI